MTAKKAAVSTTTV